MEISGHMMNRVRHASVSIDTAAIPGSSSTLCFGSLNRAKRCTLLLCFAIYLFGAKANGQTTGSGSIQGTVTDITGALLPNASVALTENSTHVTLATKTNSAGSYAFPNINVGTYSLTVTSPGFETYTSTNNVLEVGSSIAINPKLTVGSTETKVEVRTDTVALQTEDPSFKQTVDSREITEMPSNNRYMTGLVSLVGGTQSQVPSDANGSKFPTQTTGFSIAGSQGNAVTWRLDGGTNIDYMGGGNGPLPFPDAIGQFSVETAALGAQGGNEGGGLVNIVTKSGTNEYHGSAFWFVRNNYLDANDFFSTSKDTLHQNQYGGTFGGPVRIPRLFDGRNRLFFFAGFQRTHADSASATKNAYVPTAANLAGDFSVTDPAPVASGGTGVKNACGPVQQLYDPVTGALLPGNKYNFSSNGYPAVPLPTWNASALLLQKQFPTIDPALDPNACGHISYSIPNIASDNEFVTRVDYNINSKNNFYARYFIDSNQIPAFYSPTNIFLTTQSGQPEIRWQTITLGENYAIRNNLVNTVHVTAVRRQLARGFNPATPNASAFGVKAFQPFPSGIYINYGTSGQNHGANIGGQSNLLATIDDNVPVDIADDVTWIRGKHQFSFGGEFIRNQLNVNNGYQSDGGFNFNGQWSGGGGTPADANLDLLEGAMSSFVQSLPQQNALRGPIPTLYVQDTFHPTPRLTITGGIRWEPLYFPHDYFHRGATFDKAAFLANQHSTVYPNAPAGIFYYGDKGVSPNFTKNSPLAFNPNFGVSYDLFGNGKTVFRAGAAYAYDVPNFFTQQRNQQNPPFSVNVSPNTTSELCFSDPWLIGGTGNRGCGQTGGTDVDPFPFDPKNFVFPQQAQYIVLTSNYKMPDTMQWTASIQQQLPRGWNLQIFYTGNRTQHQLASVPMNPAVYTPGVWGPGGTGCGPVVTTGPTAVAAGTLGGGPIGTPCSISNANLSQYKSAGVKSANTQARLALTEANPAQGNLIQGATGSPSLILTNQAMANYNGVTVTVQHRFSSTFSLQTNYTWSKCLNDADPQGDVSGGQFSNPNNPGIDYGPCAFNIPNNFNTALILKSEFPIHGISGYLVNNWEFAPLVRLVSGTPFTVSENQDESFTGNGGDRPNLVPGVNPYNYTKILSDHGGAVYADRSYLNPAAFVLNTVPGTQGNVSRNSFRGPVYFQDDAQISRIFPIHEKYNLDLRLEAFNVLNHPSFSNPNSSGPSFTGSFGEITGTSVGGRVFQGAIKVFF
jgi:hypothetical protein